MKKLALFLMRYNLKRAKLKQENETNSILCW
jgi:hypothetical protein